MPRKKRTKSPKQQTITTEYRKQRARVNALVRRNIQRGIIPPIDIIPATPKRITPASVNRLKKIDAEYIVKRSQGVDLETGEIVSARRVVNQIRKRAAQKAEQTRRQKERDLAQIDAVEAAPLPVPKKTGVELLREIQAKQQQQQPPPQGVPDADLIALNNFYNEIQHFNETAARILRNWIDTLVHQFGENAVGKMIREAYAAGLMFDHKVRYDAISLSARMSDFLDFLDVGAFERDELENALDEFSWEI